MKHIYIIAAVIVVAVAVVYLWGQFGEPADPDRSQEDIDISLNDEQEEEEEETDEDDRDEDEEEEEEEPEFVTSRVIGPSADGYEITAYSYGYGDRELLLIGGIHGGYSPGTVITAYEMMDHLENNPELVPEDVRVTVVPVLNPDGLAEVVKDPEAKITAADITDHREAGRFNRNNVDLNRNFDCNWQSTGLWREREVDGGSEPFSEPEAQALREYVLNDRPEEVIVYYAAGGAVYSASCNDSASADSEELMNVYTEASGYPAAGLFESYQLSGDAADWLAKEGVTTISVLLSDHIEAETEKNLRGLEAVLERY